jgi:hypothetical protein
MGRCRYWAPLNAVTLQKLQFKRLAFSLSFSQCWFTEGNVEITARWPNDGQEWLGETQASAILSPCLC